MAIQLKDFHLVDLKPDTNIKAIGPNNCGKSFLLRNILHILQIKGCTLVQNKNTQYTYSHQNNQLSVFNIEKSNDYNIDEDGLIFMHATYVRDMVVHDGTYEFYNKEEFLNKYMFFVLRNNEILYKCEAEYSSSTYLQIYNKNPFCYDNVTKLMSNIKNKYSLYHKTDNELDHILKLKLDELYIIYSTIFCVKNNDIWLPPELNLEIIKLFCLSYLK